MIQEAQTHIKRLSDSTSDAVIKRELLISQTAYSLYIKEIDKALEHQRKILAEQAAREEEHQAQIDGEYTSKLRKMNGNALRALLLETRMEQQTVETGRHIQLIEAELSRAPEKPNAEGSYDFPGVSRTMETPQKTSPQSRY
jgi:hypothetical protein